ncbi:MAG: FkbM family methyltransferase [Silicimonas sp.]|nr:FkbM family methyltransferase [Silicimonas sp.]
MTQLVRKNNRRFRRTGTYVSPLAHVVRAEHMGQTIFFTVPNPKDEIQQYHFRGEFYEREELEIIARHMPVGGTYCDIGANVGNHAIFVAKFLHASRLVLIEPNPPAIETLESNLYLNGIEGICDRRHLGIGLSDGAHDSALMRTPGRNLGAARIREVSEDDAEGAIALATGDSLLEAEAFDLIKIDVEGHEIKVLTGLASTIRVTRPKLFIEVDGENDDAFQAWIKETNYEVLETFQRYPRNQNYMVGPK